MNTKKNRNTHMNTKERKRKEYTKYEPDVRAEERKEQKEPSRITTDAKIFTTKEDMRPEQKQQRFMFRTKLQQQFQFDEAWRRCARGVVTCKNQTVKFRLNSSKSP